MKTIPLEQLDELLSTALEGQEEHEAIRLTRNTNTIAWLLRLPEKMKDTEADLVFFGEGPSGRIFVIVEAKHVSQELSDKTIHSPVFGAGRGSLTIVSEDEEHLKDFTEYMR